MKHGRCLKSVHGAVDGCQEFHPSVANLKICEACGDHVGFHEPVEGTLDFAVGNSKAKRKRSFGNDGRPANATQPYWSKTKGKASKDCKQKQLPLTCNDCARRFLTQSAIQQHINDKHPRSSAPPEKKHNEQPFQACKDCGKKFVTHGALRQHQKDKHCKDEAGQTTLCDRAFTPESAMSQYQARENVLTWSLLNDLDFGDADA